MLVFIPSALLGLHVTEAVAIATASLFYQRFFHANIRTDLGPLRYVLVTPQSHRIHHSSAAEYHDANFGTIFSVWDRMFGTQHPSHREYPPAGLANRAVPVETSANPTALMRTYGRQLAYPFQRELPEPEPAIRPSRLRCAGAFGARARASWPPNSTHDLSGSGPFGTRPTAATLGRYSGGGVGWVRFRLCGVAFELRSA